MANAGGIYFFLGAILRMILSSCMDVNLCLSDCSFITPLVANCHYAKFYKHFLKISLRSWISFSDAEILISSFTISIPTHFVKFIKRLIFHLIKSKPKNYSKTIKVK